MCRNCIRAWRSEQEFAAAERWLEGLEREIEASIAAHRAERFGDGNLLFEEL